MNTKHVNTIIDGHELSVPAHLMPEEPVKALLPTWLEAVEANDNGTATPLDLFVMNNEPAGEEDEALFREQLQAAVDFVTKAGAA